jgi:hypothetical protein
MATEKYANFATTTLNGAINSSVTSITVTDGSVFPSSGDFRVTVEAEIMLCTARSSNTLTVVRGQEGTTAASHGNGLQIKSVLTKDSIKKLITDGILVGAAASLPSAAEAGRLYFSNNEPVLLRDTGSAWTLFGPLFKLTNPMAQTWSWGRNLDGSGASLTERTFSTSLSRAASNSGSAGLEAREKNTPSSPFNVTALLQYHWAQGDYHLKFLALRESATGKTVQLRYQVNTYDGTALILVVRASTDYESTSESTVANITVGFVSGPVWLRIEDNGTDYIFKYSLDGTIWMTAHTESKTGHFTTAANKIGWGMGNYGTFTSYWKAVTLLSWLED